MAVVTETDVGFEEDGVVVDFAEGGGEELR